MPVNMKSVQASQSLSTCNQPQEAGLRTCCVQTMTHVVVRSCTPPNTKPDESKTILVICSSHCQITAAYSSTSNDDYHIPLITCFPCVAVYHAPPVAFVMHPTGNVYAHTPCLNTCSSSRLVSSGYACCCAACACICVPLVSAARRFHST